MLALSQLDVVKCYDLNKQQVHVPRPYIVRLYNWYMGGSDKLTWYGCFTSQL